MDYPGSGGDQVDQNRHADRAGTDEDPNHSHQRRKEAERKVGENLFNYRE